MTHSIIAAVTVICLFCTAGRTAEKVDGGTANVPSKKVDPEVSGEEKAVLTQASFVPPPIKRNHATKVIVDLEMRERWRSFRDE
jgi:nitrite reductase (NO-forming)